MGIKEDWQAYNIQSDYVSALQAWKEALAIFTTTRNKVEHPICSIILESFITTKAWKTVPGLLSEIT